MIEQSNLIERLNGLRELSKAKNFQLTKSEREEVLSVLSALCAMNEEGYRFALEALTDFSSKVGATLLADNWARLMEAALPVSQDLLDGSFVTDWGMRLRIGLAGRLLKANPVWALQILVDALEKMTTTNSSIPTLKDLKLIQTELIEPVGQSLGLFPRDSENIITPQLNMLTRYVLAATFLPKKKQKPITQKLELAIILWANSYTQFGKLPQEVQTAIAKAAEIWDTDTRDNLAREMNNLQAPLRKALEPARPEETICPVPVNVETVHVGCAPVACPEETVYPAAVNVVTADVGCTPVACAEETVYPAAVNVETVDVGCTPVARPEEAAQPAPVNGVTVHGGRAPMARPEETVYPAAVNVETVDVGCTPVARPEEAAQLAPVREVELTTPSPVYDAVYEIERIGRYVQCLQDQLEQSQRANQKTEMALQKTRDDIATAYRERKEARRQAAGVRDALQHLSEEKSSLLKKVEDLESIVTKLTQELDAARAHYNETVATHNQQLDRLSERINSEGEHRIEIFRNKLGSKIQTYADGLSEVAGMEMTIELGTAIHNQMGQLLRLLKGEGVKIDGVL